MQTTPVNTQNTPYRLGYHIAAPTGWINDPNGFCYFKGYYHIFYQHYPDAPKWGPMHWGHARSKDLSHWETLPIALTPGDPEDKDGCFSGSAIVKDDKLYLIYTGHHYYDGDDNPDHFWENQNMAYSEDGIHFTKYAHNPIIGKMPADNTQHFRDPKVWQHGQAYYLILGSQGQDELGRVILYRSTDLVNWTYLGPIAKSQGAKQQGYMWECPDFFHLDGQDVLLFSPQGIEADTDKYLNLFQTGYFTGTFNAATDHFEHGDFQELDQGHDFYATQTTLTPDGRRIVFGWMAMWESTMPETAEGWAGALTLPRELHCKDGHLYMTPVQELTNLRTKHIQSARQRLSGPTKLTQGNSQEINLTATLKNTGAKQFNFKLQGAQSQDFVNLNYDVTTGILKLTRSDRNDARYATIKANENLELQVYVDASSLEIFINQGTAVFTERYYIQDTPALWVACDTAVTIQSDIYELDPQAITF
ncbi:Sucrose-6-phosphate hydrolase [Agrilactobacillus composti DSM 18527 = JCM 14202]|uniref:Sucrose-6-phosphate hydrolase n=1 Tax=Agrilactobacillus composti DSM 18527 = JCM 14202 TaxID=1423734 RepID=X0PQZ9_9LACO|nr:glycoside hydrolase family 32 protein [Agrilactobacillus composti]KRM31096.1 Sucrose-6-phosphate hydrolase [Agrilactobacillus composti DSM 18527 = JCM 14202]GAF39521.1 sucrose-6-phosphate hydrolase [Agrilactobacillus composti DSM 18527 = JCM 14202]